MRRNLLILILLVINVTACTNQDYSPKPRGFHRIFFPEKRYIQTETGCPFRFEIPNYSQLQTDKSNNAEPCWKNLDFPQFNARLHISYFKIGLNSTLEQLREDARTFAFKHTAIASSITQKEIRQPENNVYGLEYHIQGNTASNYQFFLSDNSKHYLRGALYFNEKPHLDSIQPVLDFIEKDISHLIMTTKWF